MLAHPFHLWCNRYIIVNTVLILFCKLCEYEVIPIYIVHMAENTQATNE